jgi:hypothetical protein
VSKIKKPLRDENREYKKVATATNNKKRLSSSPVQKNEVKMANREYEPKAKKINF